MKDIHIVTVWAEHALGPGWINQPLWVLLRNSGGDLWIESLQPDEQPLEARVLYGVAAEVHQSLVASATAAIKKREEAERE